MRPAVKKVPTVQLRSDVVVRVSRYAAHPIIIGYDTTASMRISGVFHTGDAQGFVTTVVPVTPWRRTPSARSGSGGSFRVSEEDFRGGRVCSYMNPAS